MDIKILTTFSLEESEAMRVNLIETGYEILVFDMAEVISIDSRNLSYGTQAVGFDSYIIIGKK